MGCSPYGNRSHPRLSPWLATRIPHPRRSDWHLVGCLVPRIAGSQRNNHLDLILRQEAGNPPPSPDKLHAPIFLPHNRLKRRRECHREGAISGLSSMLPPAVSAGRHAPLTVPVTPGTIEGGTLRVGNVALRSYVLFLARRKNALPASARRHTTCFLTLTRPSSGNENHVLVSRWGSSLAGEPAAIHTWSHAFSERMRERSRHLTRIPMRELTRADICGAPLVNG